MLAGCGALGCAVLLAFVPVSRENAGSTIGQLALVAWLLVLAGPWLVGRWARAARPVTAAQAGGGEPTPLWQLPLICLGLTLAFGLPRGAWDAGLRITGGCLLVGLAQALLLERVAARHEHGDTLVRLPGSRLLGGTKLGRLERP